MPGINSNDAFGGIPAAAFKSQTDLAEELGTHQETLAAIKSGSRGMSVDLARRVAAKSGGKAATVYLESQIASLKHKAVTKSITPAGVLGSAQHIMRNITKGFRDEEIDAKDPAFREAAENLKKIALAALDLADKEGDKSMSGDAATNPNPEPVYATGDSVAAATKTERDAHGRVIPEGEKVERDVQGRRIRD